MTFRLLPLAAATFLILGCAGQSAESQLKKSDSVRVCQGSSCSEQSSSTSTFQATAPDAEAASRLAALTQLAEQDGRAAYDLALRLMRGDGVQRNSYQAVQWLRKAGDKGLVDAQLALGHLYLTGFEETGSDPSEAQTWLSLAAAQGNQEAQQLLPEVNAAKQAEHSEYRIRDAERKSWGQWYLTAPYYWYWGDQSWNLR